MKFTVVWLPDATNDLARLWLGATERDAITVAAGRIDRLLAISPLNHGESREGAMRVLLCDPLGVEYKVDEDDRKVQVCTVWMRRQ
jgi:hypothetical protein